MIYKQKQRINYRNFTEHFETKYSDENKIFKQLPDNPYKYQSFN
nr:MAG TPA: hypothetical protein [Caudoviricetes sp.]